MITSFLAFIFFIVVATLVLRRSTVPLRVRLIWSAVAFLALLVPSVATILFDSLLPQSPLRFILNPFAALAEMVAPWIILAVFNEKTVPVEQASEDLQEGSDAA